MAEPVNMGESESPLEESIIKTEKSTNKPEMNRYSSINTGKINTASDRQRLQESSAGFVIWPWSQRYKIWWLLTVACAYLTVFTETYAIAFSEGIYPYNDASSILEYFLISIFTIDIVINFNLVYYDELNELVYDKREIAMHYLKGMFWFDFAGVFPFFVVALAITGELHNYDNPNQELVAYLSLVRLVRLVRLHRLKQFFDIMQYNTHVSLMSLTLTRNFCFAITWSHFSACVFYFIARQYGFGPDETWIGGSIDGLNPFEKYMTSLYWSVVTFTTGKHVSHFLWIVVGFLGSDFF